MDSEVDARTLRERIEDLLNDDKRRDRLAGTHGRAGDARSL